MNILSIVGSFRRDSVNGAVERAARGATAANDDVSLTRFDVRDIPFYDGDVEAAGLPGAVVAMHDAVTAADGLLIFSPEYNGSFPAVTKNAIDWLTRPPRAIEGLNIGFVAATPGPRAGLGVRTHFSQIMEHQPVRCFETLGIGSYGEKLEAGELTDAHALAELTAYVENFAAFCADSPTAG